MTSRITSVGLSDSENFCELHSYCIAECGKMAPFLLALCLKESLFVREEFLCWLFELETISSI